MKNTRPTHPLRAMDADKVTWPLAQELVTDGLFTFRALLSWRTRTRYRSKGAFDYDEPAGFIAKEIADHYSHDEEIDGLVEAGLLDPYDWMGDPGYLIRPIQLMNPYLELRPAIPPAVRRRVHARDGHRCLHCGTTERLSIDHIYPFSLGGTDDESNLQTLCKSCNSKKGAAVPANGRGGQ